MEKIKIIGFSVRKNQSNTFSVDEAIWEDNFQLQNQLRKIVAEEMGTEEKYFLDSNWMIPTMPENWIKNKLDVLESSILIAIGYEEKTYSKIMNYAKNRSYDIKCNEYQGKQLLDYGWKFAGYDIADIEQHSLLKHSPPKEVIEAAMAYSNNYGLINKEIFANEICNCYYTLRKDHHPFFPTALFFLDSKTI